MPAIQHDGDDQVVRLRDGRLLVGAIVEHDLDGLILTTAMDGGRYELTWRDLFPGFKPRAVTLRCLLWWAGQRSGPVLDCTGGSQGPAPRELEALQDHRRGGQSNRVPLWCHSSPQR